MASPSNASRCRLLVAGREALLDGSPEDLRSLAIWVASATDTAEFELDDGGKVRKHLTDSSLLGITATPGPVLVLSGSARALELVIDAMTGVAAQADEDRTGSIKRHAHIEYNGEGDRWIDPDSIALVISSDWPD